MVESSQEALYSILLSLLQVLCDGGVWDYAGEKYVTCVFLAKYLSNLFLNVFVVILSTTCDVKRLPMILYPLFLVTSHQSSLKNSLTLMSNPLNIFNTSMLSPLSPRLDSWRGLVLSVALHKICFVVCESVFVILSCTLSSLLIFFL